jgi:arginase family enzyme
VKIPHVTPPRWPADIPSSRFASLVRTGDAAGCRIGLIGLADDTGVRMNGGRPGAVDGPRAFRDALSRYGTATPKGWEWPVVFDAGDISPGRDLEETHDRVTEAVTALLDAGLFPIGIGGGHDLTFAFVRAVAKREGITAGVYYDAHLDVRETPGSRMAFRKLVDDCGIRSLRLHGFNPVANSAEHCDWFLANGGAIEDMESEWASGPPREPGFGGRCFVSIDLDCVNASDAPGVSAPNPSGWSPARLEHAALLAGQDPGVRCFDIMELCPAHDEAGRTARLPAHLFLSYLRGYAERSS